LTETHTVIDLGYLVYQFVDKPEYWDNIKYLYTKNEGFLLANEGVRYSNKRKEYYPPYKENRKEIRNKELHKRVKEFWKEIINNNIFEVMSLEGLEGDDLCALLSIKYGLTIVSNDKDYLQLPGIEIKHLDETPNKIRQDKLPKTLQKIPFTSEEYLLYLTINGDKADNIPQIRGEGRPGLYTVLDILNSSNRWDTALDYYGYNLIRNLMLIILPHYSVLPYRITELDVFELVKEAEYYNTIKRDGINIL
jgi:5'-3' exonuclease